MIEITINGEKFEVESDTLTYEDIVERCTCPRKKTTIHTVCYWGGLERDGVPKTEGCVFPGQKIRVKNGTEIDSVVTDGA